MKESNGLNIKEDTPEHILSSMDNFIDIENASFLSMPKNETNFKELMVELDNYRKRFNEMLQIKELMIRRSYEAHIQQMNHIGSEILEKLKDTARHADALQLALSCAIAQLVNLKESCSQMAPFLSGIEGNLAVFNGLIRPPTLTPNNMLSKPGNLFNGNMKDVLHPKNNDSLLKLFLSNGSPAENAQSLHTNNLQALGIITPTVSLQNFPALTRSQPQMAGLMSPKVSSSISYSSGPSVQLSPAPNPSSHRQLLVSPSSSSQSSLFPSVLLNASPADTIREMVLSPHHVQVKSEPVDVKLEPVEIDTVMIAHRVREILANHNIGQRLFARNVLSLSQGTVSELLSKPKSWDKLTERGRDLYRKMDQWSSNEANYLALKLAPTSAKIIHKNASTVGVEDTEPTGDRIVQILKQAQVAMSVQHAISNLPNNVELQSGQALNAFCLTKTSESTKPLTKFSNNNNQKNLVNSNGNCINNIINNFNGGKKFSYDDSPSDSLSFVTRIYREQLLDLLKTAERNKNVIDVLKYQHELNRLSNINNQSSHPTDLTNQSRYGSNADLPEDLSLPGVQNPLISSAGVLPGRDAWNLKKHSESSGVDNTSELEFIFDEKLDVEESKVLFSEVSKQWQLNKDLNTDEVVQRVKELLNEYTQKQQEDMSSVQNLIFSNAGPADQEATESMSSSSSEANKSAISNRCLRTQLPPISNAQWEQCNDLNTEEIVQRVKEILNEYSISQRSFGECVLGLSQGSVSDLLARPKPYQLLTQKGREPFVRMKYFLDNPALLHNFVQQQSRTEQLPSASANLSARKRRSDELSQMSASSFSNKRSRTAFTTEKRSILLEAFKAETYPTHSTLQQLANQLNVNVKSVFNWFHNQRMRDKDRYTNMNGLNQLEDDEVNDGDDDDDDYDYDEVKNNLAMSNDIFVDYIEDNISMVKENEDKTAHAIINNVSEDITELADRKGQIEIDQLALKDNTVSQEAPCQEVDSESSDIPINLISDTSDATSTTFNPDDSFENLETLQSLKIKINVGKTDLPLSSNNCISGGSKRKRNRPQRLSTDPSREVRDDAALFEQDATESRDAMAAEEK